jgi:hypothetical protein
MATVQPRLVDDDLALLEGDSPLLGAVVDDVAVGLLALLPGARDGLGAHPEHRLDGGAARDVDEVVEGARAFSRRSSRGGMSSPSFASRSAIRLGSKGAELPGGGTIR